MDDLLSLTVTIGADEWARAQRRIRYLEAALVQAYRAQRQLKEWFSAAELVALGLPDMPATRQAVVRRAHAENWLCRICSGRGGERYEFHFSNLPRKAFEEMIRRIIEPAVGEAETTAAGPIPAAPFVPSPEAVPVDDACVDPTMAPPWELPLMRMIRGNPGLHVDTLMTMLDVALPQDAPHPTREEVASFFRRHGRPV